MICSDVVKGAFQLCGRPSQDDLPYQDVLDHAGDVVRGRLTDMNLVAQNRKLEVSDWVTPDDRQTSVGAFALGADDFIVAKVEWRPIDADENFVPYTAEVVSFERLDELAKVARGSETFVAFYGDQDNIAFSETYAVLADREYRIWYEGFSGFTPIMAQDTGIPDPFITLCKYETALRCLDQVENGSQEWADKRERLRTSLTPIFLQEDARFRRWNTSQYGNKVTKKLGFRPRVY